MECKHPKEPSREILNIFNTCLGPGTFGGSKSKSGKGKSTQQKGRSLEEALKDPTLIGNVNKWNSNDPNFNVLMSEMGVKLNVEQSSVEGFGISKQIENKSNVTNLSVTVNVTGKRSPIRGEGISPDAKRINRRPSGSPGNISKCKKRLQIGKPKENKEINLKLNALKELKNSKKVKTPTNNSGKAICDTDENDDILCDILSELTHDVKTSDKHGEREMDIEQFQTQYLPTSKKAKRKNAQDKSSGKRNKICEQNGATNGLPEDEVDSRNLLNDIIEELTQSTSCDTSKRLEKRKPKKSVGPEIYDSQMDMLSGSTEQQQSDQDTLNCLEDDFKNLSPFK